jgi:hypothetical protein
MNCEAIQEQLLQCEDPGRPAATLARHLAQCSTCRAFRQQLLELEDGLRRLPAPRSHLRDRLLARLQEGELPTPAATRPSAWRWTLKERAQQKLALALTLAASLALFALGWGLWPHAAQVHQPDGPGGPSPVRKLFAVAEKLRQLERNVLGGQLTGEAIERDSVIFVEFAEEELPRYAAAMSPAQRAAHLPDIINQLRHSESELGRACARVPDPPESLRRMVQAAQVGQTKLRDLLG